MGLVVVARTECRVGHTVLGREAVVVAGALVPVGVVVAGVVVLSQVGGTVAAEAEGTVGDRDTLVVGPKWAAGVEHKCRTELFAMGAAVYAAVAAVAVVVVTGKDTEPSMGLDVLEQPLGLGVDIVVAPANLRSIAVADKTVGQTAEVVVEPVA